MVQLASDSSSSMYLEMFTTVVALGGVTSRGVSASGLNGGWVARQTGRSSSPKVQPLAARALASAKPRTPSTLLCMPGDLAWQVPGTRSRVAATWRAARRKGRALRRRTYAFPASCQANCRWQGASAKVGARAASNPLKQSRVRQDAQVSVLRRISGCQHENHRRCHVAGVVWMFFWQLWEARGRAPSGGRRSAHHPGRQRRV